jgi:hypothetical protein
VSGQLHASAALFPGKSHRHQSDKRLGGTKMQPKPSWEDGRFVPTGNWTLTPRSFHPSPVAASWSKGIKKIKKTPWPQSASELYRPSDRRLSAKSVPTFLRIEGGQRDGSLRPYSRLSRPEPLLFIASSSSVVLTRLGGPRCKHTTFFLVVPGNRTRDLRICSQVHWPLDHRGGRSKGMIQLNPIPN